MKTRILPIVMLAVVLAGCEPAQERPEAPIPETKTAAPASDAYRGAGLARQVCAQCHHVTAGPPPDGVTAESFIDIANREDVSRASISSWLRSSHPSMPNFIFDDQSVEDLSAYIMSLQRD